MAKVMSRAIARARTVARVKFRSMAMAGDMTVTRVGLGSRTKEIATAI